MDILKSNHKPCEIPKQVLQQYGDVFIGERRVCKCIDVFKNEIAFIYDELKSAIQSHHRGLLSVGILLHHDDACLHIAAATLTPFED